MEERIKNIKPGGLFKTDGAAPKEGKVMPEKKVEKTPVPQVKKEVVQKVETKVTTIPKGESKKEVVVVPKKHVPSATDISKMSTPQLIRSAEGKFLLAMNGKNPTAAQLQKSEKEFAKETSFALQAFSNNSYLETVAKGNKLAVINAIINVAQSGLTLNPVLKLGYLVPMDKKVQFWPSYMGKREVVMRTGLVRDAYARLVYDGDFFEIKQGTGSYLRHTPDSWAKKERKNLKGGYWYCILKDGTEKFDTMPLEEIEAIAKRSPSAIANHSPWKTDWEQMALKTIFNRGFKEMPKTGLSEDQIRALEISDKIEEDTMKTWVNTSQTKQEAFDEDTEDSIEEAQIV